MDITHIKLEQVIRIHVLESGDERTWVESPPFVELMINFAISDSTRIVPFNLVLGELPDIPIDRLDGIYYITIHKILFLICSNLSRQLEVVGNNLMYGKSAIMMQNIIMISLRLNIWLPNIKNISLYLKIKNYSRIL